MSERSSNSGKIAAAIILGAAAAIGAAAFFAYKKKRDNELLYEYDNDEYAPDYEEIFNELDEIEEAEEEAELDALESENDFSDENDIDAAKIFTGSDIKTSGAMSNEDRNSIIDRIINDVGSAAPAEEQSEEKSVSSEDGEIEVPVIPEVPEASAKDTAHWWNPVNIKIKVPEAHEISDAEKSEAQPEDDSDADEDDDE